MIYTQQSSNLHTIINTIMVMKLSLTKKLQLIQIFKYSKIWTNARDVVNLLLSICARCVKISYVIYVILLFILIRNLIIIIETGYVYKYSRKDNRIYMAKCILKLVMLRKIISMRI